MQTNAIDRKAKANSELCEHYGVACYRVSDIFGEDAPEEDQESWFVSVLDGSSFATDACRMPLFPSQSEAEAAAVKTLRLTFDA